MKKFSNFKFHKINEQEITLKQDDKTDIGVTASVSDKPLEQTQTNEVPVVNVNITSTEIQPGSQNTNVQSNIKQEETKDQPTVVKLFSKFFESREMAHVYHLQVNGEEGSYAAHIALNTYYDAILGHIDTIIEVYQAQYGIVEGYETIDTTETKTKDKVEYFESLVKFIKDERKCIIPEDTHLHNTIDEIVSLIYQTLYRLKFNK